MGKIKKKITITLGLYGLPEKLMFRDNRDDNQANNLQDNKNNNYKKT